MKKLSSILSEAKLQASKLPEISLEFAIKAKKQQIAEKLVEYGNSDGSKDYLAYVAKQKKPELIKKVKIYNTNVRYGGDGNYSEFRNDLAYIPTTELIKFGEEYTSKKIDGGIDTLHKATIKSKELKQLMLDIDVAWRNFIETELYGFIAYEDLTKAKAKYLELFKPILALYNKLFIVK